MSMTYQDQISQAIMNSMASSLLGLYLHGSLALNDFVAGKSDVDLCAVVNELRNDQRQRLIEAVSPGTFPIKGGGFDIHIVTAEAARTASLPPLRELWVANHPGAGNFTSRAALWTTTCL